MTSAKCFEIHGHVDPHDDDMEYFDKQASNVGLPLRAAYRNRDGVESIRTIDIDSVFGESLSFPRYIRGLDSISGERRTFDVNSIIAVILPNLGVATEHVPFFVGTMIRRQFGLETPRAPIKFTMPLPLIVELVDDGEIHTINGALKELSLEHRSYGPRFYLTIKPDTAYKGSRRPIKMDLIPTITGYDMKTANGVFCAETGEEIKDIYGWAAAQLGLNEDGWPQPETTGDK